MTQEKGSSLDIGATTASPAPTSNLNRGQPAIVFSIPGDAPADEIEALDAILRAAKTTGSVSREEILKAWLE